MLTLNPHCRVHYFTVCKHSRLLWFTLYFLQQFISGLTLKDPPRHFLYNMCLSLEFLSMIGILKVFSTFAELTVSAPSGAPGFCRHFSIIYLTILYRFRHTVLFNFRYFLPFVSESCCRWISLIFKFLFNFNLRVKYFILIINFTPPFHFFFPKSQTVVVTRLKKKCSFEKFFFTFKKKVILAGVTGDQPEIAGFSSSVQN